MEKINENSELVKISEPDKTNWQEAFEKEAWVSPFVNIYENNNEYVIVADLPGLNKENLKVKLENNQILILGKIDFTEESNKKYIVRETRLGNYYRKFNLSNEIDKEKIVASFENGRLLVTLGKNENAKPKTIVIN